jgi:hypothetical protein
MRGLEKVSQFVGHDMGVDLGCRYVGVPEQKLDDPEVGPAGQKVGCEGVAKGVGAYSVGSDARFQGERLQYLSKASARDPSSGPSRRKDIALRGLALGRPGQESLPNAHIGLKSEESLAAERGEAFLVPFSADDQRRGAAGWKRREGQVAAFRSAKPRAVEKFNQADCPYVGGIGTLSGVDQSCDLLAREDIRRVAPEAWAVNPGDGVVRPFIVPQLEPEETSKRRQSSGGGCIGQTTLGQVTDIGGERLLAGFA